jgi:hypothetical protein
MSLHSQIQIKIDSSQTPPPTDACIANISTEERQKRLRFGLTCFALSLIVLAVLVFTGGDRLWRLPLFFLFAGATTGFFQWYDKTCVAFARINSRKVGDKMEVIEDEAELAQVKAQARKVQLKAFLAAIPMLLIALALPVL